MTFKVCHTWEYIEYIEATCPYCSVIDTYFGINRKPKQIVKGDMIDCSNPKCGKRFQLGEQE